MTAPAEAFVLVAGILNAGFLVSHAFFWRLFSWGRDLASLTFINCSALTRHLG